MVKAIETEYNGYLFRSRAEARWAIFFDLCGMKYQYEPEGFVLSDGTKYLPDFYLPESNTFVEVKGIMSDADYHKIIQLQEDTETQVVICYADMTFQASNQWEECWSITDKESSIFAKCYTCKKYFFLGNNGGYACPCCGDYDGDSTFETIAWGIDDSYLRAREKFKPFIKAKQARFEHGEKGILNV